MKATVEEIVEAPVEVEQPRIIVVQLSGDDFQVHQQGVTNIEAPTLLRLAAKTIEDKLGI